MTDQSPCPRCGCTVSDAVSYYFIPVDNLRWHSGCWKASKAQSEKPKEEIQ